MQFAIKRRSRVGLVATLVLALTIPALGIQADAATKISGKAKVNTTVLPTVSAHAGVAPVIGKASGAAPKTLVTKDIIVGKGTAAISSSTVTAQYVVASWKTGQVYQTSWTAQPFTAPLSNLIAGWQQGIPGMKIGGRRLFIIPPSLAYGAQGAGNIPPNETLIFVVDLLAIK